MAQVQTKAAAKRYGGFWPRVLAFGTDYIMIGAYLGALVVIGIVTSNARPGLIENLFGTALSAQAAGFLLITLPFILYFSLSEAGRAGATWGKRWLGMRVTTLEGGRLSYGRAFGRTVLKVLPWELAHTCIWQLSFVTDGPTWPFEMGLALVWLLVGANIVCMLRSPRHQTLYDRLAGTTVKLGAAVELEEV